MTFENANKGRKAMRNNDIAGYGKFIYLLFEIRKIV